MLTKLNFLNQKNEIDIYFEKICQANPDIKLELTAAGELIIMSPTGGETGNKNAILISRLVCWNEVKNQGLVFDSSTCFKLASGSLRSPDVSWISLDRWETLTQEQKKKFPPIAPDFVLELMSESDNQRETQEKMVEYRAAGVRLGWLINPQKKQVEIYRTRGNKEILNNPPSLSGEDVLVDFVINLSPILN